tara:strand:+ start:1379 stop:1726 length:348 start_codon:yes stop_codon:yes gene_type:complete
MLDNVKLKYLLCHRKPSRSFFFNGKQFPLCSRCTGIYFGYLLMPVFLFKIIEISLLTTLLITLPTILDGFIQAFFKRESTNLLRVSTGFVAGIGIASLVHIVGEKIGLLIKNLML